MASVKAMVVVGLGLDHCVTCVAVVAAAVAAVAVVMCSVKSCVIYIGV
jgi:hypothetical protein